MDMLQIRNIPPHAKLCIGLDIGHGECAVYYTIIRDPDGTLRSNPVIASLYVANNKTKISSIIAYSNGKVVIGDETYANPIAYFKRSPARWNETEQTSGKTYKELMKDFIAQLVRQILSQDNNPDIAGYNNQDIVLCVGCPSDPVWIENRVEYEVLIRQATGINTVMVVPESTAAIFSTINTVGGTLDILPEYGIIVFDFGSSTADCTYIRLGDVLFEKSWTLGASYIEANMVEEAIQNAGVRNNVWDGGLYQMQLQVRRDGKEAWYGDSVTPGLNTTMPNGDYRMLQYIQAGQFGEPMLDQYGGLLRNGFMYRLNQGFIDIATNEMATPDAIMENGQIVCRGESWRDSLRRFMEECKNEIVFHGGLPCKTVILTGGASRMDFVKDIAEDVFSEPETMILRDPSPSYCVCNGLCQIVINNCMMNTILDANKITNDNVRVIVEALAKEIMGTLTRVIFTTMVNTVQNAQAGIRINDLRHRIANNIAQVITPARINQAVKGAYNDFKFGDRIKTIILEKAKQCTEQLYSTENLRNVLNINIASLNDVDVDIDNINFTNIAGSIPAIHLVTGLFNLIGAWLGFNVRVTNPAHVAGRMTNNRTNICNNISHELVATVDNIINQMFGFDNSDLTDIMNCELERAIKVIALDEFENIYSGKIPESLLT